MATATELQRLIAARCTVHDYAEAAVDEPAVERALALALAAPNHRMTEPWRFTLVGKTSRIRLLEISLDLKARKARGALDPSTVEAVRAKMMNPAVLAVVSQVRHQNPGVAREDYAAIACALQNVALSLHSEGIGSKWSTGDVTTDPRTYAHLGIDEAAEEIVGFFWIGMAAKPAVKVPRKLALESVLRRLP